MSRATEEVDWANARRRRAVVALMVTLVVGIVLGIASIGYPITAEGRVGAGLFPLVVAILLVISSVLTLVLDTRGDPVQAAPVTSDDEAEESEFGDAAWRVPVLAVVLVGYVVVVEHLGHLITSCLLAWVCLRLVGGRSWWQQLIIALALGIGTAELFARMGVQLPLGVVLS